MDQTFLSSLEATLKQITAPQTVNAATTKLQSEFYTHSQSLPALVHLLQQHPDAQIRQLAGVEARKLVSKFWDDLDDSVKSGIRSSILTSTLAENQALVRHTSSRVISTIAMMDLDDDQWPELLPFLHNTTRSANAAEREVAIYVIYTLLEANVGTLIEAPTELLQLFSQTINDPESLQVRVSTVLGLGAFAETLIAADVDRRDSNNPIELFRKIVPSMVEVLKQVISADDEKGASEVFEVFNTLLVVDPALISKHLGDLVQFMLRDIASETGLSEDMRNPALQFLLTAVRFKKSKIQSLKLGPVMLKTALQIIAQGLDAESEDDEDLEDSPVLLAERLIEGLSYSLPPTHVVVPLLEVVPEAIHSQDPRQKRAVLLAIAGVVEGSPDYIANHIDDLLQVIVQALNDPNMLVKVDALRALGSLAQELQELVASEHETLIPLVFNIMSSASSLNVGRYACRALDAILEVLDRKVITEKYLDTLVPKLLPLLASAQDISLKSTIVAAISSAATSAGPAFKPYFETTIQAVQSFVRIPEDSEELPQEEIALCGITLDLLGSVAGAVGRDEFRPYMPPLMDAGVKAMRSSNSRMKECGMIFVGTIARAYGEEFAEHLHTIVPLLIECLEQNELEHLLNEDDDEDIIGQEDEDETENQLAVTSAIVSEKEIALETISELILSTQGAFASYLEKTTEVVKELSDHYDETLASAAVAVLLNAFTTMFRLSGAGPWTPGFPASYALGEPVKTLAGLALKGAIHMLQNAEELTSVSATCYRFALALKAGGPALLGGEEELQELVGELLLILNKTHPCQTLEDDDLGYDDKEDLEGEQESSEYDEDLIDNCMDVVVQTATAMGANFKPLLPTFIEAMVKYTRTKSARERACATGALAEIVNGLRQNISEWTGDFLQLFIKALGDKDLEVRSNAAFGIGLLCYFSEDSNTVRGEYVHILQKLQRLLKKVDKNTRTFGNVDNEVDSNDQGLANACGCVARMTLKYPDLIPLGEVLPVLVSRLPLKDGFEENTPIFELFLTLFQQQNETIIGLRSEIVTVLDGVFARQAEIESHNVNRIIYPGQEVVYPIESDALKHKLVDLLKYLESEQHGLVSSKPHLANLL
ncbi:importin subunit beta-4 [Trichomonascus vanleenenianus]|uniref:karyopherin KAP123 n=1 Tax=Trichomonascus vanleenenianus TaxID=2268995 RepID=UPI003EC9FFCB